MIIGTHLIIADIIYKYISIKTGFNLHWPSFAYGNIKPDLDKGCVGCWHTLEDSLCYINEYAEEITKCGMSVEEFSMKLGVVCHLVCDYFCLYHSKMYWKKDPLGHAIHEIMLHIKFLMISLCGSVRFKHRKVLEKSLKDLVKRFQQEYSLEPGAVKRDIIYSLAAASQACEMVVYSSKVYKTQSIISKNRLTNSDTQRV